MFYRLEAADGSPELFAFERISDGHIEAALGAANLLNGERGARAIEDGLKKNGAIELLADDGLSPNLHAFEDDLCLISADIDGRETIAAQTLGVAVHEEEPDALIAYAPCRARRHDDPVGACAVKDIALDAA